MEKSNIAGWSLLDEICDYDAAANRLRNDELSVLSDAP
jgi:hypothetical protein